MSPSAETPATSPASDALFPVGAPDVALGGLGITRALLQRGAPAGVDEGELHWVIFGVPNEPATDSEDAAPFSLVGDFALNADGWFVGLTVTAPTFFRDPPALEKLSDDELNGLSRALGQWASHLLYDFAASHARQLVAGTWGCEISIPLTTPEPQFVDVRNAPHEA